MRDSPVNLSTGLPETILPDASGELQTAMGAALDKEGDDRRVALAAIAAEHPSSLDAWAHLSESGRDPVEAYAYARVGYHRGLDALRKSGWRGTGYVRWRNPSNQGFLRSLEGLRRSADLIGESEEAERCRLFLLQCDPEWAGLSE